MEFNVKYFILHRPFNQECILAEKHFQAKNIQTILNIPKHRYEYISSKIGITPEISEVEGRGRAHLYSGKNLMQYAYVHFANQLGLSPAACRDLLELFDQIISIGAFNFYILPEVKVFSREIVYYVMADGIEYFALSSKRTGYSDFSVYRRKDLVELPLPHRMGGIGSHTYLRGDGTTEFDKSDLKKLSKLENDLHNWLFSSEAYIVINISTIKQKVMDKIR
jgi:hypothetical protein